MFDDFIVVGKDHLYIFSYDLQLKNRIHIENDIYKVTKDANSFNNLKTHLHNTDCYPVLYKNNIYIPYNQQIAKIIFCPDVEKDIEHLNKTEDMQNADKKPAYIRFLSSDEYKLNYVKYNNSDNDYINVQTVQVENKIKQIYISEDGTIYGLNYSEYGLSLDKDTLYGIYNEGHDTGEWDWIY